MDADNKDNPNPTILSASDLPSRLASTPATKTPSLFDALATPHYPSYADALSDPELSDAVSDTSSSDDSAREEIDAQEIYDLIATISDPEHPNSLASLAVVNLPDIFVLPPSTPTSRISTVRVLLTPTTAHCSLGTVIGLAVRVRLEQSLPPRFRIDVQLKEGTHTTGEAVNKQLADKERVAAAMENGTLVGVIRNMLSWTGWWVRLAARPCNPRRKSRVKVASKPTQLADTRADRKVICLDPVEAHPEVAITGRRPSAGLVPGMFLVLSVGPASLDHGCQGRKD